MPARTQRYARSLAVLMMMMTLALWPHGAQAQSWRAVVLSKQTLDNQAMSESGLEAVAAAALRGAGLRLLDLESALRVQRAELSDIVQTGRIPAELSALNADVVLALQLRCARAQAAVLGTALQAQHCVLDSKAVRTSNGEVLFARTESFMGHGLNAQMAVQSVLEHRLPEAIAQQTRAWLASLARHDAWETDLTVSRLTDHETARSLVRALASLPGVSSARMAVYDRGLAKYVLSGKGAAEREALAEVIAATAELPLSVTYEASEALHAEFDLAAAYKQRIMAMSIIPHDDALASIASEVLRAALMNVPYLEMAHTLPVIASPETARDTETKLRARARELNVPLLAAATLTPNGVGWTTTLKLIEADSGKTLTAATSSGETSTLALDATVRAFDARFRSLLVRSDVRERFRWNEAIAQLAKNERLVVRAFKLPATNKSSDEATLELYNASRTAMTNGRLTLMAASRSVELRELPAIAPGSACVLHVPLASMRLQGGQPLVPVTATILYRTGPRYERALAVAPWVAR
ncbi:MAG: hypothetical protein RL701_5159 [Pseudomonadota bacterium]|jgi:hypothetical protein